MMKNIKKTFETRQVDLPQGDHKNNFFIKMEPDANALFWNDNESDEERGFCIGDDEHLTLPGRDIDFNMPELKEWLSLFVFQALAPCESGETTPEDLAKTFDWRDFHKRGIALAVEVKKLLPKNCVLKYAAPFEDKSGLLPDEVLIDEDLQHVENVQENLFNFLALKDGAL